MKICQVEKTLVATARIGAEAGVHVGIAEIHLGREAAVGIG